MYFGRFESFNLRVCIVGFEEGSCLMKHSKNFGLVCSEPFRPIWDLQVSRSWILGLHWLGNQRSSALVCTKETFCPFTLDLPSLTEVHGWVFQVPLVIIG